MKKILTFISIIIFSSIAYANDSGMKEFRDWLIKNGQNENFNYKKIVYEPIKKGK